MSQPYVGEIRIVGFNFAPQGWAFCDGAQLAISQNDVLFNLIGTTYGGDGVQTFNLPDLQGRVPIHMGSGFVQGQFSGTETATLSTNELPSHSHILEASSAGATANTPAGNVFATASIDAYIPPTTVVATTSVTTADPSSGGGPHENMMPFLGLNFIISMFGIYPSQT